MGRFKGWPYYFWLAPDPQPLTQAIRPQPQCKATCSFGVASEMDTHPCVVDCQGRLCSAHNAAIHRPIAGPTRPNAGVSRVPSPPAQSQYSVLISLRVRVRVRARARTRLGVRVRARVGVKVGVGVQSGQNFPLGAYDARGLSSTFSAQRTPEAGTFGNQLLVRGPLWRGPVEPPPPPPPLVGWPFGLISCWGCGSHAKAPRRAFGAHQCIMQCWCAPIMEHSVRKQMRWSVVRLHVRQGQMIQTCQWSHASGKKYSA